MLRAGYANKEGKAMPRAGYESKKSSIKDLWFKKKINSTPSFNKIWNIEVLPELS